MRARPASPPRPVSDETHLVQRRWTSLGTPASDERLSGLDRLLVRPLKSHALWARHRWLYAVAHSIDATLVNLFDPFGPLLTPQNSPFVVPDTSFGGDGVAASFNTGINLLTDGGAYQKASAFMFVWSLTDLSGSTATDMGNSTTARVIGRNGTVGTYNANSSNSGFPNENTAASYGWTRRGGDQVAFRNGVVVHSETKGTFDVANANLMIGYRGGSSFSARQFALIAGGGELPTNQDIADLTSIYGDYLAFVGAI